MSGQLVPRSGGEPVLLRKSQLTVGRRRTCDIVLDDPSVSGRHAEFELIDDAWYLTDCGSTNGTFVDGVRCESTVRLEPGAVIAFFKTEFVLEFEEPTTRFALDEGARDALRTSAGSSPGRGPVIPDDAALLPEDAAMAPEADLPLNLRSDASDDDEEFKKRPIGPDGLAEISVYKIAQMEEIEAARQAAMRDASRPKSEPDLPQTVEGSVDLDRRKPSASSVEIERSRSVDDSEEAGQGWDEDESEDDAPAFQRGGQSLPRVGRAPACFVPDAPMASPDGATPALGAATARSHDREYVGFAVCALLLGLVVTGAASSLARSYVAPSDPSLIVALSPAMPSSVKPKVSDGGDPGDPAAPAAPVNDGNPGGSGRTVPPPAPDPTDTLPPLAANEIKAMVDQLKEVQKADAGGRDVLQLAQLMQSMSGKQVTIDPDDPHWIGALRDAAGGNPDLGQLSQLQGVLRGLDTNDPNPTQSDVRAVRSAVDSVLGRRKPPNPEDEASILLRLSGAIVGELDSDQRRSLIDIVQRSAKGNGGVTVADARAFSHVLAGVAGLESSEGLDSLAEATGLLEQLTGRPAGSVLDQILGLESELVDPEEKADVPRERDPLAELKRLRRLETYAVGPEGDFADLRSAFGGIPAEGAVVALVGGATVNASDLPVRGGTVVLTSTGNGAARVAITGGRGFHLTGGEIRFRGLTIAQTAQASGAAIVEATSGRVQFHDCRVTIEGAASVPAACVRVTREATGAVDARFTETFVRGDSVSAVATETGRFDLAVADSLFVAGRAPFVTAKLGTGGGGPANIRLVGSTIVAATSLFLAEGLASTKIALGLLAIDTVVAREGTNGAVISTKGTRVEASWQSTNCVLTNWSGLVQRDDRMLAKSFREFERLGPVKADASLLSNVRWPPGQLETGSTVAPVRYRQAVLRSQLRSDSKVAFGCDVSQFDGDLSVPTAPIAVKGRTEPPTDIVLVNGAPRPVDLGKVDLGKFLSSSDLPDGAHVVASGSGAVRCSPFVIEGRSLKLEFASGAAPLVLVPFVESSDTPLMTVRNGSLELVNATILADSRTLSRLRAFPTWYVRVIDGNLGLRRCRLLGPTIRGNVARNHLGLIDWQRSPRSAALLQDGGPPYDQHLIAEDSFLGGTGTLIRADGRGRAVFLRNVVGTSRQDLVELDLSGFGPRISCGIDISGSTLAAKRTVFTVTTGSLGKPCTAPLRFWVDRTVFGPPMREPSGEAHMLILKCPQVAFDEHQILWEGRRNGFAPEVTKFVDDEYDSTSTEDFDRAWQGRWGAEHVVGSVAGPNAVLVRRLLDVGTMPEPVHFELEPRSAAATLDDGRPIGADPNRIVKQGRAN